MKSKSFDLKKAAVEKSKHNKTFDFIGLYKSTAETNKTTNEKSISSDISKDRPPKGSPRINAELLKCEQILNKNKKKKNECDSISQIDIDGSSLNNCSVGGSTSFNDSKITSTPNSNLKSSCHASKVKSIMKTTTRHDDFVDDTENVTKHNSKKRNKSVSFMLDDNEDVVVKKIKPDTSKNVIEKPKFLKTISLKKFNKVHHSQKENKSDINQNVECMTKIKSKVSEVTNEEINSPTDSNGGLENTTQESQSRKMYKKMKKVKNHKPDNKSANVLENESTNEQPVETKGKKIKKKKHQIMSQSDEGEPASKARKTDIKPDIIAEDLENLNIGDNTHTLSNLLDEMTVVDKNKRKKSKVKEKKLTTVTTDSPIALEGEKEKLKWKRRKWNKDKKGDIDTEDLNTSVIVENLPISIMLMYKNILAEYFEKCGLIKKIGIAEVYPTEESKPVFPTTVKFYSDGAATLALEENNSVLEGSRIRVKRPLPATETTIVLRSYAELNEQNVTSLFTGAGKIRNIRHLVKGKKAMSTAFVEFDGPESVERAIKKCKHSKIGTKKVHITRFEVRMSKKTSNDDEVEAKDDDRSDSER